MIETNVEEPWYRVLSRRRIITGLAALPLLAAGPWHGANAAERKRLGVLAGGTRKETLAFHAASMAKPLAELGWIEGRTLEIVWRFAEGDESRFPALAKELVEARPDVIGTASTGRTRALQLATRTIPIVTTVGDPVGSGFAQSLARPGSNITGFSLGTTEAALKQFELLKAALPRLATVVIVREMTPAFRDVTDSFASAARATGIAATTRAVSSLADVEDVFRAVPPGGRGAAALLRLPSDSNDRAVMQLAIRLRVPTLVPNDEMVEAGGLLSYTFVLEDQDRRTAVVFDKLFRGADPGLIPFELPQRATLAINRRTAAAIGVKFPADFAIRATRVID